MKILLPIDGSALSLNEVHFALRLLSSGLQGELLLVNVQAPANLYEIINQPDPSLREQVNQEAGLHAMEPALALVSAAGVAFESLVVTGSPPTALLELIELHGCDLVVMGTHGAGPLRSAWEGSVAKDMLHLSPVPVLLVKPDVPDEEDALPET
jgi:nucleotide-binding universal stress UspA family protein